MISSDNYYPTGFQMIIGMDDVMMFWLVGVSYKISLWLQLSRFLVDIKYKVNLPARQYLLLWIWQLTAKQHSDYREPSATGTEKLQLVYFWK